MKKAMKCMAGILALTLAFAQVAPVSAFAEETTATTATEEAQAVYSGDCSAEAALPSHGHIIQQKRPLRSPEQVQLRIIRQAVKHCRGCRLQMTIM